MMLPWEGRVWCNPPYGANAQTWLERMAIHGNGVALIFARTETAVWQDTIFQTAHAILFVKGRIKFYLPDGTQGGQSGAPSALVAWGAENAAALKSSGIEGFLFPLK